MKSSVSLSMSTMGATTFLTMTGGFNFGGSDRNDDRRIMGKARMMTSSICDASR